MQKAIYKVQSRYSTNLFQIIIYSQSTNEIRVPFIKAKYLNELLIIVVHCAALVFHAYAAVLPHCNNSAWIQLK